MSDLLCPDCKQDHAQPLKHWCDKSDLEIQFYKLKERASNLQSENTKLKEQLAVAVEALGFLKDNNDFQTGLRFSDALKMEMMLDKALKQIKEMDR